MNIHRHKSVLEVLLQPVQPVFSTGRVRVNTCDDSEVEMWHNYIDVFVSLGVVAHIHEVGVEMFTNPIGGRLDFRAMISVPLTHEAPSLSDILFFTQGTGY